MSDDTVRWIYELSTDYSWQSPHRFTDNFEFKDKTGVTRLLISRDGVMTVTAGYAWDGCTPKIPIWDILVGTPDGAVSSRTRHPKTYFASLVHDALYQFVPDGLPITKLQADRCFLALMSETGFKPRYIYFVGVVVFGGLFRRALRRIRHTKGSFHIRQATERSEESVA